jgi:glyoxylase-like metal-dependent hydrolase (beta-lactamase superfamily II)
MKLVHIAGDTFYVPGMTNVCIYKDYVIDPGKNRHVDWARPEASFGRPISRALVTHAHEDHFWHAGDLRDKGTAIYAPSGERAMIEDIAIHTNGFFLWVKPPEEMKPWYFRGRSCPVDGTVEGLEMPLKVVPLPGHTDAQAGYLTPDGVLVAADSMVAKDVWDTTGIFYFTDVPETRRTLKGIMDNTAGADWVLPTHTELLTPGQAAELAEVNMRGLDRLERLVLDAAGQKGASTEAVTTRVCLALDMKDEFSVHLVGETIVRAFLHSLYEAGAIDYELKGHQVLWRVR